MLAFSFFGIINILIYFGIIIFGVYFGITVIKEMKEKNEILKEIRNEMVASNNQNNATINVEK